MTAAEAQREPAADKQALDESALREQVRSEVVEELEHEQAERRRERMDARLNHMLDTVAGFAEEFDLDQDEQADLEMAFVQMFERMGELRAKAEAAGGEPSEEMRDAFGASFETFEQDVQDALQDPELADAFFDRMGPRGRR